jgi:TonB family protein
MKGISFLFILTLITSCASREVIETDPIRAALLTKQDEYRECFLESDSYKGRKAAEPEGVVRISFTINAKGKATNGKVYESPFKDANFHACILSMVRMIQFPLPENGGTIEATQPIRFRANI